MTPTEPLSRPDAGNAGNSDPSGVLPSRPARPHGLTDPAVHAEAASQRAFWQGSLAPIEALLPPGVNPTRLRQMPASLRRSYVRAIRGEASPKEAIKAQCSECMGYDRDAVATCTAPACPLWRYRPWQSGDEAGPTTGTSIRG